MTGGSEHPYFENDKSEVQRGKATCLRAHSDQDLDLPEADLDHLLSLLGSVGHLMGSSAKGFFLAKLAGSKFPLASSEEVPGCDHSGL